ncbi:MAG: hypothetical protein HN350_16690 [Phycisphaerales bacterium]|nr:hypothetical protein [Phycisphaerales bacterium]
MLLRRVVESAGVGVIVGGLIASGLQLAMWMAGRPGRAVGIIVLGVAMLAGAIVSLIKGVSLTRAARYMDSRASLDERLTTAVELAGAGDVSPAAKCVYSQAAHAAKSTDATKVSLWIRGRVTAATAMLSLLLCGALMMLPQGPDIDQQIVNSLDRMSPEAIKALAAEFARAAQSSAQDAPVLVRGVRAIKQKDSRVLAAVLEELRRRGVKLVRIVRPEVLAIATAGGAEGDGSVTTQPADSAVGRWDHHAGGAVHVWDPLYDKLNSGGSSSTKPTGAGNDLPTVGYADAWTLARLRAARALRSGDVGHEYRRMVREFFSDRR